MLFLVNRIGTLAGDWKVGLLAAAYWALGPLYLSIIGSLATGGHVESCAFSAFIILSISLLVFKSSKNPVALSLPYRNHSRARLVVKPAIRPFSAGRGSGFGHSPTPSAPWAGFPGWVWPVFLLGSLPFWLWEFLHDFSTFGFFEGHGVGIFNHLWSGLYTVLRFSLFQSFLGDWWDGHRSFLRSLLFWPGSSSSLFICRPFSLSLLIIVQWIRRIISLRNPFQGAEGFSGRRFLDTRSCLFPPANKGPMGPSVIPCPCISPSRSYWPSGWEKYFNFVRPWE